MTAAGQRTNSPAPAPGGTAPLAGRTVARIGFGAMQLEQRAVGRDAALAILALARRAGVNHIDTAHFYGRCNAFIHDALAPYPDDLVLVSKAGADRDADGQLVPAQRPEQLRAQIEANLATLGAGQVGVVNLRRELGATPAQVALAWLLAHYDNTLLIPGTSDPAHLAENIAAGSLRLSGASVAALDQLSTPV